MKLKVCGMKYVQNIQEVAALQPDYLGFIFYEKSTRNFEGIIPDLPKEIKKAGVFVNEIPEIVVSLTEEYGLNMLQLHGDESPEYITTLKTIFTESIADKKPHLKYKTPEIVKVFGIKSSENSENTFDFELLKPYEALVDFFLFDTKGKERGGNGITFDWSVLQKYNLTKPFFLSGGIGLEEVSEIKKLRALNLPIYALDVNSKFETSAGLKSVKDITKFKKDLNVF
ncbi:phosphoribosylanthranilate isomerase [Tenacibaculum finnmarkense]|uniref:phosphoribosylanthranilate isomerase n=2 Tax=Tenacibaculum finnmarkense TaxID=2781243 RepID=UPI001EFA7069|nr:phosphoribosylanthranilate isomerase [Tenacibaculum finnmarkense]MCG8207457.1 phosphoribosylanthranilate isomerase [Tenacibaculum finnmarkense genomovar finnmarkense]MCG8723568.1 phosphoribosylanthranilate isomerase [Tenacibaculum finnmarkense]MCG8741486.1 phosphoribosylanthranilate isomerase [Tenacibaculum finnmarkense]MCG8765232.1 phosphoribosylanthranilate isomerase [Tenacibaculum finnmarkense]MCG8778050.1 phosphoribosylanthranilate isomerase [Tenacibaculum finnmarkense]